MRITALECCCLSKLWLKVQQDNCEGSPVFFTGRQCLIVFVQWWTRQEEAGDLTTCVRMCMREPTSIYGTYIYAKPSYNWTGHSVWKFFFWLLESPKLADFDYRLSTPFSKRQCTTVCGPKRVQHTQNKYDLKLSVNRSRNESYSQP